MSRLIGLVARDETPEASEERISSGAKWRAANVDLPDPAGPTRTTRLGSGMTMTATDAMTAPLRRDAADLVPAGIGCADLVRGLVVQRRSALDAAVAQPETAAVPGALDAAIDELALGQRPSGMGAHGVQDVDGVARCERGRGR